MQPAAEAGGQGAQFAASPKQVLHLCLARWASHLSYAEGQAVCPLSVYSAIQDDVDAQLQQAAEQAPLPKLAPDALRRRIEQLQQTARSLLGRKRFMQGRIAEAKSAAGRPASLSTVPAAAGEATAAGPAPPGLDAEPQGPECPVCYKVVTDDMHVFSVCGHSFCQPCAAQQVLRGGSCAVCRAKVTRKQVFRVAPSLGRRTAAECDPDHERLQNVSHAAWMLAWAVSPKMQAGFIAGK